MQPMLNVAKQALRGGLGIRLALNAEYTLET